MKICRIAAAAILVLALASCADKAAIECTIADAPKTTIVVKQLEINSFSVLDTVSTDADGKFKYKVNVSEGQPEFIYLFRGDAVVASLLLEKGEKVEVTADTLGNYTVAGSEGSLKLKEVAASYSKFIYRMAELAEAADNPSLPQSARKGLQEEMSKLYVAHYRECINFVMKNPYSLTVVPVYFQQISEFTPVFSAPTDGIRMKASYDSLMTVYPESRYVKALGKEAERRLASQSLRDRIANAERAGYPDIICPDVTGKNRPLSGIDAKAILIHFWTSADAGQKMFNIETLKPLYDQFHSKGFEIYSVCIDPDKAAWAATVRNQQLEWINVNDGLGTASPILSTYNVTELPSSFFLIDGELASEQITGVESLRKILSRELK